MKETGVFRVGSCAKVSLVNKVCMLLHAGVYNSFSGCGGAIEIDPESDDMHLHTHVKIR